MSDAPVNRKYWAWSLKLSMANLGCFLAFLASCYLLEIVGFSVFYLLSTLCFTAWLVSAIASGIALFFDLGALFQGKGKPKPTILSFLIAVPAWLVVMMMLVDFLDPFAFSRGGEKRSKVARVKGDQRTLTIALETYYLDFNEYPAWTLNKAHNAFDGIKDKKRILKSLPTFTLAQGSRLQTLTTPNSYVSSYFVDPFAPVKGSSFCYWTRGRDSHPDPARNDHQTTLSGTGYIVWSPGPDGKYDITIKNVAKIYAPSTFVPSTALVNLCYDPSNGTVSGGDVYRFKQ